MSDKEKVLELIREKRVHLQAMVGIGVEALQCLHEVLEIEDYETAFNIINDVHKSLSDLSNSLSVDLETLERVDRTS